MIGRTLNHYRILEKIGSGGMGEVYAAEDTTLNRRVAVKILPPAMAADPERLGRFEREAKAVAALNHPNIVTIHSIEKSDPSGDIPGRVHFLTMELVEGRPLSQILPKGGLPLARILDLGLAMTEAMARAHEKGITHRDLKPDNVMIAGDGRLKILDFGLAKLKEEAAPGRAGSEIPTRVMETEEGKVLGTVAYMSPEQAEGKPVDARSDVFSLGVILYEMATGERPFRGDTKISIISSILRDTPGSVTDLNRNLPRHLGRIVRRCLAKDPDRRYGNAKELHNDLLELKEEVDSGEILPVGAMGPTQTKRSLALPLGAAILAVAVVATGGLFLLRGRAPAGSPSVEFTLTRLTQTPGVESEPSLSPDGRMLVFVGRASGNQDIYFQVVGGEKVLNLTEDGDAGDRSPTFSPDGTRIAFRSERRGGGIFVMGTTGESVRRLTDFGFNPSWSPDGREVLFSTEGFVTPSGRRGTGQVWAVSVETGGTRRIPHEGDAVQPAFSPHGRRIAYWGLHAGSGQRDIWTIPAEGGEAIPVTDDSHTDWAPAWSPDGGFLYFASDRGGSMNLWRVPIEEDSGRALGTPQAVTSGVGSNEGASLSADGRLVAYAAGEATRNLFTVPFDPAARAVTGEPQWITRGSNLFGPGNVSPDGEWLAFTSFEPQEDLYVMSTDGSERRQITSDPAKDRGGRWSPDGTRITFYSDRDGGYEIWTVRPDGSDLRPLTNTPGAMLWLVWSPDGTRMAALSEGAESETWIFDPTRPWADQTPEVLPRFGEGKAEVWWSDWSPDGTLLAGSTSFGSESGAAGILIYSLASREYRRLVDFGFFPRFLSDGRSLLFIHEGGLYLAEVETGETEKIPGPFPGEIHACDLAPDDSRLYCNRSEVESDIWLLTLK